MLYRLGTTGYHNPGWAGTFYPEGLTQSRWLTYYASRCNAIELNNTFHAMPTPEKVRRWRDRVGDHCRVALKATRAITHDVSLEYAIPALHEFIDAARHLGPALGPILLQLPPGVGIEQRAGLAKLLDELPHDIRFAIEFRTASWFQPDIFELLEAKKVALVAAELEGHPESSTIVPTADFLYIRLLGRHGRYPDETYERFDPTPRLIDWHHRIEAAIASTEMRECWVLFNNDYAGHAPATLRRFAKICGAPLSEPAAKQRELF